MDTIGPRLRARTLSLRWKAFGVVLLLLGIVHGFFGVVLYRQLLGQYATDEKAVLAGYRLVFEGLLEHSAQGLQRTAAQIGTTVSVDALRRRPFDPEQLSPELLANLSGIRIFDAGGQLMADYRFVAGADLPAAVETTMLARVRSEHRPLAVLVCRADCVQVVFEPAFDRDGAEIVISVGQSVAESMQAFAQQTGADIALLSASADSAGAPAQGRVWGRYVYALTHAPKLRPMLAALAAAGAIPGINGPFAGDAGGVHLMLLRSPLGGTVPTPVETLLVVDQTAAQRRIRSTVRSDLAANLVALILGGGALWVFLTPVSRRLKRISNALPLLAEQKFAEARAMLGRPGAEPRFADEIDRLANSAQWLSQRLEVLNSAEAASEAKSRYVAIMSHEVRTPLNGILGVLELLQYSSLDTDQRDSIRMVRESAQSLLHVLDDSLDLARIEAGRIDLETAPFSIEDVLEGCVETLASRARPKHLRLISHVDPALPPQVLGDAMRLRQVLHNLCSNAIKFTASGRVVVRAQLDRWTAQGVSVRFSVADTGVGIPREAQAQLFKPFHQAEASTAARFGGSGLGLSICHGLVERMGGSIDFDSEPGKGTEFRFLIEFPQPEPAAGQVLRGEAVKLDGVRIAIRVAAVDERGWLAAYLEAAGAVVDAAAPLALVDASESIQLRAHEVAAAPLHHPVRRTTLLRAVARAAGLAVAEIPPAESDLPARRLRILAVDDHPTNRLVIERQLRMLGHDAILAGDGVEALRIFGESHFDLVMTDLHMPKLDGYTLISEIRGQELSGVRAGHIPILVMTAQVVAGEAERCRAVGVDGFLPKPLSLVELRKALTHWAGAAHAAPETPPLAPAGESAEAPVDREFLRELIGDDPVLTAQLLDDFLRINAPLFDELGQLIGRGEFVALAALAHRLLGSAKTAAAAPLARLLAALEQTAKQELGAEAGALAERARLEFERIRDYAATADFN